MSEQRIDVCDGKYTFILPENDWQIEVQRYSEPWLKIAQGHKAVGALLSEFLENRAALDAIHRAAEQVNMASPMAMMESLAEFHALVYAQTHPGKPEALCDAHRERMEGKDATSGD